MLEWFAVGIIIAVTLLLLGRAVYRSITSSKPTCACGHVDCPVAGECSHLPDKAADEGYDCPLSSRDSTSSVTGR